MPELPRDHLSRRYPKIGLDQDSYFRVPEILGGGVWGGGIYIGSKILYRLARGSHPSSRLRAYRPGGGISDPSDPAMGGGTGEVSSPVTLGVWGAEHPHYIWAVSKALRTYVRAWRASKRWEVRRSGNTWRCPGLFRGPRSRPMPAYIV